MNAPMDAYAKEEDTHKRLVCLRDRAIFELLFSTGLRVSELCALNSDIDLARDELSVRGKGDKVRVVFLSPAAKDAVRAYLKDRKDMDEALFMHGRPEKLHRIIPRDIQLLIKRYAAIAGITSKVTPHTIRHAFATDLLSNGADIRSVQVLLGHASINTTQIYTHVTDAHLREVHKRFHSRQK
jgi:site-specific recombinase XerD